MYKMRVRYITFQIVCGEERDYICNFKDFAYQFFCKLQWKWRLDHFFGYDEKAKLL